MYNYETEKKKLFTEDGVRCYLLPIRDNASRLLKESGSFQMFKAWKGVTGDGWRMIAAIDFLTEHKQLIRVTPRGTVTTQDEVYIQGSLPI